MIVHRSNRIEALVEALVEVVGRTPPDPFAPEWIAVQGRGMGRWLSMELARRLGVWANPSFPFPRRVIEAATAAVLGETVPDPAIFAPDTLLWAIAELLPRQLDRAAFAPIRAYLDDDPRGAKRLQLAARLADRFDQYAVFRPQMVLDWERGTASDWQAALWRALVDAHGAQHAAARAQALLGALAAGHRPGAGFPRRISLFGLSTLPPLYVQILAALSRCVELRLFLLSPSREYWGEIRSRRETIRARARRDHSAGGEPPAADADEGHPLLASLGRVGREFQNVLEELVDYQDAPGDHYVDPGTGSALAALQADILALRTRGSDPDHKRLEWCPGDDSIAVHACHGPMREVEVLHDQLLALFDRDPTLEPQHVVVMTPSIDVYAPVIDAVFGGDGRPKIPFRIADRSARTQQEVADAFLRALELLSGRLTAPAVLDLLALDPVRERFAIAVEELDVLRRWVVEAGVRWGADGAHRAEVGQPGCDDNTWRFGLDRLLLGYALPGDDANLFGGVLPADAVEGSDGVLLGRFADFCATLCHQRTALREPRHPTVWREALSVVLGALVARTAANAHQHQAVRAVLDALAERAGAAGFTGAVDLTALRVLVEAELQRDVSPRGFLTGAVTFCELVPMRTIPFRVVCLLGLNDGEFPRLQRHLSFDRMAERRRAGDRTARDDDRYLFLEALLSARERLVITYVGQSISDNSELPPSVVVSELLDAIDQSFAGPSGRPARERVLQRHPLQPFSPTYFRGDPDGLFSYARSHYEAANALIGPRAAPAPFWSQPLPGEPSDTVALDDLVRFFDNPSRWFLQRRCGLYLGRDAEPLDDREPIELDALDQWQVGDGLLRRALRGGDLAGAWPALRASGTLPLGALGRCAFTAVAPEAEILSGLARAAREGERLPPEEIELHVGGVRLSGVLREVWPGGQVFAQYSRLGGYRELGVWIRHLVRSAATAPGAPSSLIGRPQKKSAVLRQVWFRPVDEPLRYLSDLLDLYRQGQCKPLPFFKRASRKLAEHLDRHPDDLMGALNAARKEFDFNEHLGGADAEDAYVAELYRDVPPFGAGDACADRVFADAARTILAPLLAHRETKE